MSHSSWGSSSISAGNKVFFRRKSREDIAKAETDLETNTNGSVEPQKLKPSLEKNETSRKESQRVDRLGVFVPGSQDRSQLASSTPRGWDRLLRGDRSIGGPPPPRRGAPPCDGLHRTSRFRCAHFSSFYADSSYVGFSHHWEGMTSVVGVGVVCPSSLFAKSSKTIPGIEPGSAPFEAELLRKR